MHALWNSGDAANDRMAGTAPPALEDYPAMGKTARLIDCKPIK
jgi:hypothetical protein